MVCVPNLPAWFGMRDEDAIAKISDGLPRWSPTRRAFAKSPFCPTWSCPKWPQNASASIRKDPSKCLRMQREHSFPQPLIAVFISSALAMCNVWRLKSFRAFYLPVFASQPDPGHKDVMAVRVSRKNQESGFWITRLDDSALTLRRIFLSVLIRCDVSPQKQKKKPSGKNQNKQISASLGVANVRVLEKPFSYSASAMLPNDSAVLVLWLNASVGFLSVNGFVTVGLITRPCVQPCSKQTAACWWCVTSSRTPRFRHTTCKNRGLYTVASAPCDYWGFKG